MKNFLLKVVGSILKSVIVFVILFFLVISLHSGKFPPDRKLAKDYINQLAQAKEKYTALTHRSENYLKNTNEENVSGPDEPVHSNNDSLEDVQLQLKSIKSQLNRIEEQNKLILNRSLIK